MYPSPILFYDLGLNAVLSIFGPIYVDVGADFTEDFTGICLFEPRDIAHKLQSGHHLQAILKRYNGTVRTFILLDRTIAIERYEQHIRLKGSLADNL